MTRLLRFFRPSHQHTAFSATLLLMGTVMLSRVIGYVREAYIAYAFGEFLRFDWYVQDEPMIEPAAHRRILVLDRDGQAFG